MLDKVVQTYQTDWPSHVPFVVNAYNTTAHSSTGYTPFFLMFGREQRAPLDIVLGTPGESRHTVSEYARILLDNMRRAHALAWEKLLKCSQRMKKDYDFKVKQFSPGQLVWVLNPELSGGGAPNGSDATRDLISFWKTE